MNTLSMDGKKCLLVNASAPEDVRFVWPYIRHYILSANERAKELDEVAILGKIFTEQMTLFVVTTDDDFIGAFTVELQSYPLRKIAQVVHLGSKDFNILSSAYPEFLEWAKSQGAEAVRIHGRKGWEKKLVPLGFKPQYYVLETKI